MSDWSLVVPWAEVTRVDELVFAAPDPLLAAHVLSYSAHDRANREPLSWRMTPLGAVMLTIDIVAPRRRLMSLNEDFPVSPVLGLRDAPMVVEEAGHAVGVTVGLTPPGAYALFGLPLGELAHGGVAFADIHNTRAVRLTEQLAGLADWPSRFRLLDRQLLAWLRDGPDLTPQVHGAWLRLTRSSGRVRISALAEEIGWTRHHLLTRFREQIGLAPKTVARVARLHRAASLMTRKVPLADIAHLCGYADQSHLNRDFRDLTGLTPTAYMPQAVHSGSSADE